MENKSLLFVNQTLGIGGAETFNTELLRWLKIQKVKLFVHTNNEQFIEMLNKNDIGAKRVPFVIDLIGDWKGLVKGIALFPLGILYYFHLVFKSRKVNSILMTGFVEKIIITPIAKLMGIKTVWIEFGPLESVLSKFGGFPGMIYKLVSKLPDKVIMSSNHTIKSNIGISGIPASRIKFIPCAVTVDDPKLNSVKNLAVCVSRLEKGKGQDLLIKSWKEVVSKIPSAKLRIVGEGSERDNLISLVKGLGLQDNISIVGRVENAVKELSRSSIVVFPSLWPLEGFGMVAVEALAVGRPVVIFNRGPLPEIVDSKCGVLVEPGDIQEMTDAILKLFNNPTFASDLGKKGKIKYQQKYTWDVIGSMYLNNLCLA